MIGTLALVETAHARKYLRQLAKHFSHKVPVTEEGDDAIIVFSCGTARISADDATLRLSTEAASQEQSSETQGVLERHLLVFAHREALAPLSWGPA